MGNHRFRLSDMMPNAWFYKLKDKGTRTGKNTSSGTIPQPMKKNNTCSTPPEPFQPLLKQQPPIPGRASYYISSSEDKFPNSPANPKVSDTKYLIDPPRKSKKKHRIRPCTKLVTSSVSSGCTCRASVWKPESLPECPLGEDDEFDGIPCSDKPVVSEHFGYEDSSCTCRVISSATDIIIDMGGKKSLSKKFDLDSEAFKLDLPPILTKPARRSPAVPAKEERSPRRRSNAGIQGVKMRANSPRLLATKKMQQQQAQRSRRASSGLRPARKGLSESFAVVKSSSDPQRDFRESMMEMIVENNICGANELEDLLACYLSLNSNEYHDVIVKVFEQIWFDLTSKSYN